MIQLFLPLGFLGFVFREIKGSMANIEKMFELMAVRPTVVDAPDATELDVAERTISFEGVRFGYTPERTVLDDVSFTIDEGKKVAVVGVSGSGKSTLVKLLFRFYDPDEGRHLYRRPGYPGSHPGIPAKRHRHRAPGHGAVQ